MSDIQINILISLISIVLTLLIREWFSRRKEQRDKANWQITNLKYYYFDQYLSEEIKGYRKKLQNASTISTGVIENLELERDKISKALQRIGSLTYLGGIPLSYILMMNSLQAVGDWVLILPFIKTIRGDTKGINFHLIPFVRRHGEWLALVCWMWIQFQKFEVNNDVKEKVIQFYNYYGSINRIVKREKLIFLNEELLVSKDTKILVKQIRFRYLLHRMLIIFRVKKDQYMSAASWANKANVADS